MKIGYCSILLIVLGNNSSKGYLYDFLDLLAAGLLKVGVASYALRGSGKEAYYEYEVRIEMGEDRWHVYRRCSQFRSLYKCMKDKYGSKVSKLPGSHYFIIHSYL